MGVCGCVFAKACVPVSQEQRMLRVRNSVFAGGMRCLCAAPEMAIKAFACTHDRIVSQIENEAQL